MKRTVPSLTELPRPVFSRNESLAPGMWTDLHHHPWHQLSYAISGVLNVQTAQGSYVAPPTYAVWIPRNTEHKVFNQGHTEMRSLYLQGETALASPCTVIEVGPLLRELICKACELPVEYEPDGPAGRLIAVLLDELAAARPAGFTLPLPQDRRLLGIHDVRQRSRLPTKINQKSGYNSKTG